MESKKINQLATAVSPSTSDLAIIGDPVTGVSKKITWLQVSTLIGTAANLQQVTDNGATTTNPVTIGGLTITGLSTGVLKSDSGVISSVPFGAANGVATLAGDGKVPSNQLPSYVDDVVEVANYAALPVTGETGKIYITLDNNKVYRWGGSVYVEVAANQAVWGSITGTLANQTDLQNVLNLKATDSLVVHLAGTETITGTKTFSNASKNDGGILLQNGSSYSLSGYMNLGGMTDGLRFTSGGGISNYFALPSSVGYTYTLPAISGTIVAISGGNSTQYIDGTGALQTFPTLLSSDKLVKLVRNQSGATMTAGTIVYISGATGNKPLITKAIATGDSTSAQTYGLVQANIANNADGYVVVIGNITDIDTSALTEGQQLYLSGTTAGAYTTTKPYAPIHLVYIGIVLRSHPTQGIIGVKIQNGYEMDELHNVDAQSPSNNDILSYNTSTSLWEHKQISTTLGFTPISLASLSAVSPLIYNNGTGAFSIQVATASQNGYLSSTDWSTFNNKQAALGGTGFVKISGSTISYDNSTYYLASNPSGYITLASLSSGTGISYNNTTGVINSTITQYTDALARAAFSESVIGLDYSSSTGVLSTTTGYAIPTTAKQTNWDTAYNDSIVSAAVSGTTTKTLTLTQQDAGTITASWTDDNTDAVSSVFGRTGAVIAVSGDYTTAQVTESGNLYFTDSRARAALSFVAGSGAYNSTTGVITIPTNNNQITNGAGYITGNQTITLSGDVSGSGATAITTTIGAGKVTNAMLAGSIDLTTKVTGLLPDANISSAATWNAKQAALNGTGFVKATGTTISYDNSTYLTTTTAASTYQTILTNPVTGTGTASYLSKWNTGGTSLINSGLYNSGNLFGIGLSSFKSWETDSKLFETLGDVYFGSLVNNDFHAGTNSYLNASSIWKFSDDGRATNYYQSNGVHGFRVSSVSGIAGDTISWLNAITIATNSDVTIGNSMYVTSKLSVNTAISNESLKLRHTSAGSSIIYAFTSGLAAGTSFGMALEAGTNSSDRTFVAASQSGTEYFKIRGDGFTTITNNVSIGNTSNAYKLDVTGNFNVNYDGTTALFQGSGRYLQINVRSTPSAGDYGVALRTDSGSYLSLSAGQAGVTGAVIDLKGNIGIRTAASTGWWDNVKALQLGNEAAIYNDGNNNTIIANNSYFTGVSNKYLTNGYATRTIYERTGGAVYTQIAATSGIADADITYNTITHQNNTGFGIKIEPATLFHTYSATDNLTTLQAGTSSGIQIRFKHGSTQTAFINSSAATIFAVYQGTSTEKFSLNSSGQFNFYHLGDAPISNDLYGNIIVNSNGNAYFSRIRFDVNTTPYWGLTRIGSSNDFSISGRIGSSWSDNVFRIYQATGNVQIGAAVSGGGLLQVNGDVNINGNFKINGTIIGGGGGSGVTGSGTTSYVPRWTSASALGNSLIYDNGTQVTIGGTTGGSKLNVFGAADSTFYAQLHVKGTGTYPETLTGIVMNSGTAQSHLRFAVADVLKYQIRYNEGSSASNYLGFYSFVTDSTQMIINAANGNVIINSSTDSNSSYKLQVTGSIYSTADVVAYSDISVKKNIRSIENALLRVTKSRGVLYDRKDIDSINNIGFIAQELEEQFPELISLNNDGTKGVKYQNAVAVLFEAIKEQQKQIDGLKKHIA